MSEHELDTDYSSLKKNFQLTDEVLSKPVSDKNLEKISLSVALKWKILPVFLDLKKIVADNIEHDCSLIREPDKRRQFLLDWKASKGSAATYKSLILALLQINCRQDAESVCKLLLENPESDGCDDNTTFSFLTSAIEPSHFKSYEMELVDALKGADLGDLLRKAVRMKLISDVIYRSFDNLESSPFISHSDKIRYLLLHACEGLEKKPGQCALWRKVLCEHATLNQLVKREAQDNETPVIVQQTPNIEVNEGKSTLLIVEAVATGKVSYQWTKNGAPLEDSDDHYLGINMPILCVNSSTLAAIGSYTCQLKDSNGSVAIESEPIKLTVKTSRVKELLLSRYSNMPDVKGDRKGLGKMTFVNLALIKENEDAKSKFAWSTIQGTADDIKAEKEEIQYSEAFSDYKNGFLVLIEGRPGSGKTTLVNKITKDWAKGKNALLGAKLVFLVPLRALPMNSNHTIDDILGLFFEKDDIISALAMIKTDFGKGVCFILDGLDEYIMKEEENSVVNQLIRKTFLHESMVIVASRPAATAELRDRATLCYEVLGFLEKQIFEYIEHYDYSGSSDDKIEKAKKLKSYLAEHVNIFHMCFLPVHTFMICFLYEKLEGSLPRTESGIYKHFTLSTLSRKASRKKPVKSFDELANEEREYFDKICEIAFQMSLSREHVFKDDELVLSECSTDEPSLGLITTATIMGGIRNLYSFAHLTFQEYLAACHLSILEMQEQIKFLSAHGKKQHMKVVVKFFCGIVSFKGRENLFKEIVSLEMDNLFLCQCAFESQEESACNSIINSEENGLTFNNQFLSHTDFIAIHYVISVTSSALKELIMCSCNLSSENAELFNESFSNLEHLECLDLSNNNFSNANESTFAFLDDCNSLLKLILSGNWINDVGANALANSLQCSDCSLELVDLTHNTISDTGIKSLCATLQQHTNLKILKLGYNRIGNNGAKLISHVLKCNANLISLHVDNNILSGDGVTFLAEGLKYCAKLESLCLDNAKLNDNSAQSLSDSLKNNVYLRTLSLVSANITQSSAAQICKCFSELKYLQVLKLGWNGIGEDGAKAISKSLRHCDSLKELDIYGNGIDDEGASALAESLKYCKNLSMLNVSDNRISDVGIISLTEHLDLKILCLKRNIIGDEGGRAIADNLQNKSMMIVELDFSSSEISCDTAIAIAAGLEYCKSLKSLNLSFNDIRASGVKAISEKLKYCEKLIDLNLVSNYIKDEGAVALAEGLKFPKNNLQSINLGLNYIDAAGAKALSEGLKYCRNLREIDLGFNNIEDAGVEDFCKCLRRSKSLVKIDLSRNNIGNAGASFLANNLKKIENLKTLLLENNKINDDGACILIDSAKDCKALETLNLNNNKLHGNGALALAKNKIFTSLYLKQSGLENEGAKKLAQGLKSCCHLETLDLQSNNIGNDGVAAISSGLRYNRRLKVLHLGDNKISDISLQGLKYCHCLETLHLQDNQIGEIGASNLGKCLLYCTNLKALDLSGNHVGDGGAKGLGEHLSNCINLKALYLKSTAIGDAGMVGLGEGLSHCTKLTTLDLSNNHLGKAGGNSLGKLLSQCINLEALNLKSNRIGEAGVVCLGEGLSHCTKLETLDLEGNQIGDAGANSLGESLNHCTNLLALYLHDNQIGDAGAKRLGESLKHYSSLIELNLSYNQIGDAGAKSFREGLRQCTNLKMLNLNHNQIGDEGAKGLGEGLNQSTNLEKLWLCSNQISYSGVIQLCNLLSHYNAFNVELGGNPISYGDFLRNFLLPLSEKFQHLFSDENNCTSNDN